jgi:hypothetical protein
MAPLAMSIPTSFVRVMTCRLSPTKTMLVRLASMDAWAPG